MVTDLALKVKVKKKQSVKSHDKLGGCHLQVPGEVNVEAVLHSEVVAEQLKRDDVEQSLETINRLGHTNRLAALRDIQVVLVANDDRLSLASRNLRVRGLDLGVKRVLGHDDDNRHILVDESERTVLELSGEDALGVHVRDFLDLECAFQACGVLVTATHDEETPLVGEDAPGELLQAAVAFEDGLDLGRQRVQSFDDLLATFLH